MKEETIKRIRDFTIDRNWEQFHSPANLAKALSIEASELLECFLWDEDNYNIEHVKEELADVRVYAQDLLDKLNHDILHAKMDKHEKKYPIEKSYGSSKKYNEI